MRLNYKLSMIAVCVAALTANGIASAADRSISVSDAAARVTSVVKAQAPQTVSASVQCSGKDGIKEVEVSFNGFMEDILKGFTIPKSFQDPGQLTPGTNPAVDLANALNTQKITNPIDLTCHVNGSVRIAKSHANLHAKLVFRGFQLLVNKSPNTFCSGPVGTACFGANSVDGAIGRATINATPKLPWNILGGRPTTVISPTGTFAPMFNSAKLMTMVTSKLISEVKPNLACKINGQAMDPKELAVMDIGPALLKLAPLVPAFQSATTSDQDVQDAATLLLAQQAKAITLLQKNGLKDGDFAHLACTISNEANYKVDAGVADVDVRVPANTVYASIDGHISHGRIYAKQAELHVGSDLKARAVLDSATALKVK